MTGYELTVDLFGFQLTFLYQTGYLPGSLRYFPAGRVAQCQHQAHSRVVGGVCHASVEPLLYVGWQFFNISYYSETDIVLHERLFLYGVEE